MKHWNAGVVYLAGGLPLQNYFVMESLAVTTRHPPFKGGICGESDLDTELMFEVGYGHAENDIPLGTSLQYGGCKGPEEIIQFYRDHTDLVHKIPHNYDAITTVGSTHGWDALLRTLCDEGVCILG
jgi:aromatic amino acid aminotransferase I